MRGDITLETYSEQQNVVTVTDAVNEQTTHQSISGEPGLDSAVAEMEQRLNEKSGRIKKRPDMMKVLEIMGQGVLVDLNISLPRFIMSLSAADLGLAYSDLGLELSDELRSYVQFGRRSLIPKAIQKRLTRAEARARECLYSMAVDTPWRHLGYFIPTAKYQEWKEKNAQFEQEFWDLRDELVVRYDELVSQVLFDYQKLALESWNRLVMGSAVAKSVARTSNPEGDEQKKENEQDGRLWFPQTDEEYRRTVADLREIQAQRGSRESFVEVYLDRVRAKMPSKEDVREGFKYVADLNFIPLPSLLARDVGEADRIYRERAMQDEQHRMSLERLEVEHRAQFATIEGSRRAEEEAAYKERRQQLEEEHQRKLREQESERLEYQRQQDLQQLQYQMERDVIQNAQKRRQELVDQFYFGVIQQINEIVFSVCRNVQESLHETDGYFSGGLKKQINNLKGKIEALNIIGDEQIEDQIERLRAAASHRVTAYATDGTPYDRVDTGRLNVVLSSIMDETNAVLIGLGHSPQQRRTRSRSAIVKPQGTLFDEQVGDTEQIMPSHTALRRSRRVLHVQKEVTSDREGMIDETATENTLKVARRSSRHVVKKPVSSSKGSARQSKK
jgi:hypothetical protein